MKPSCLMICSSVFVLLCSAVSQSGPQFGLAFGLSDSPHIGPRLRFSRSYALQPEVMLVLSERELHGIAVGVTNLIYLPPKRRTVEQFVVGGVMWGRGTSDFDWYLN